MLGTAVKVTGKQFPRIAKLAETCADTLRIPVPTLYVSPNIGSLNAHTFGTAEDPYIVVNAALIDHLTEPELLDVIGHECGHIQNSHVVYMTTLHFLKHAANMFLRWSVKPAVLALNGWARRAEITCDRAGLICTRDLDVSVGCLVKLAIGSQKLYSEVNIPEYLAQLEEAQAGLGRFDELTRTHPYLPKRVAALRLFAETTYFRSLVGTGRAAGGRAAGGDVQGRLRRARRGPDLGAAMTAPTAPMASLDEKKAAIRSVLADLAAAAEAAGLPWVARDVRDTRLPKLDDERFSVVVLGEFNHGKSTFINALLGSPLLPTGITPTTALLAHVTHGARAGATAVSDNGDRTAIDAAALADHLTVDGLAKAAGKDDKGEAKGKGAAKGAKKAPAAVHHVEITHPSPLLANRLTIVDTPGVNDINEQRAD